MPKILVTPHMLQHRPGPYSEILAKAGFEISYVPEGANLRDERVLDEFLQAEQFEAIIASMEPLNRRVLTHSSLRVVARMGVGYDSVDIAAADDLGIVVTITPGTLEVSVAEHTIALMFAVTRDIIRRDRNVREGRWPRLALPRMEGKTFGIVGLGRIGRQVVPRVKGLGMKVMGYDPFVDESFIETHQIERCATTDELFSKADVISLHLPTNPETINLINERTLALMKPTGVLINTGRGGLVDEEALYQAMSNGHLLGAALDVFKKEPLPTDSPLLSLDNLVTCEHMGGLDQEGQVATSSLAASGVVACHEGGWPRADCVVSHQEAHQWKWANQD